MIFSVLDYLEHTASNNGQKIAIVDGSVSLNFHTLRYRALAIAQVLKNQGIKPGDRVGICMAKSADQIIAILATLYAGAIFVPILPALKRDNISHIVNDSGMFAVITDEKRLQEVSNFINIKVLIANGEISSQYPNLNYLSSCISQPDIQKINRIGVDVASIIYSSGSTGRPKGIMVTHRNLADGAKIVAQYLGTKADDRIACVLSFNFDYGLNQIWQSLLTGASIHLHELIMPNECIRFLSNQGITALPLMPAVMTRLFDPRFLDSQHGYDLSKIRYICSSGGRISPAMLSNIAKIFPQSQFYSMFGLTEAFRSTFLPPEQLTNRPNSIGKAIPDVEILVLNEDGQECLPGVVGELVHRGGCISKGYWNDPIKTAERFKSHPQYPGELLVYSGDLVKKDEEGYIMFVNRKDEMLKNNGIRISPTEIEETLEKHPLINSVVVFGIENIEVGHDIVAVYTTHNNSELNKQLAIQFLKINLPTHMVPKFLVHQEFFPHTGNQGKIDRVTVKQNAKQCLGIIDD